MSTGRKLRSKLFNLLVSEKTLAATRSFAEKRRRLARRPHVVSVFLELDDPYSYLLARYLPGLAASYDIELRYCLTQACAGEDFRPHSGMLAAYAEEDCRRLAAELGVPFLDRGRAPPVEYRRALIDALAANAHNAKFDDELLEAISLYWRGDSEGVARRVSGAVLTGAGDKLLADNQKRLVDLGHYNSATVHYAGEWYWGIDRLHYLTERLDALGARREGAKTTGLAAIRQAMHVTLPVARPSAAKDLPPLEFFYSFRSPYSYLSAKRVLAIADAFGLQLQIRPVLPMLMRGLQVPRSKLRYIATDTGREARRLDIPYGNFADPLGRGVERCLAVFIYAKNQKRERDFLLNAGEAIWARGIDVATDKGMRWVTGRTALFWPDVLAAMQDDGWQRIAEDNRESMMESGCWGVPTMRLGDFVVWGQDRDWLLVRHIEEHCDTGDGILV
ncbi:MAG: DsbA family protein [Gammaproteobacteria bacterium]|nr:DsbA family protein [Gammaproteobacteria bacterium]MDH3408593.1 DsbA family protein [Gammaproteobacteria bacterium]